MSAPASLGFAGRTLSERCLKGSSVILSLRPLSGRTAGFQGRMPENTTEGFWDLGAGHRAQVFSGETEAQGPYGSFLKPYSHSGTRLSLKVQPNPIQSLTLTIYQAACQRALESESGGNEVS